MIHIKGLGKNNSNFSEFWGVMPCWCRSGLYIAVRGESDVPDLFRHS